MISKDEKDFDRLRKFMHVDIGAENVGAENFELAFLEFL